MIITYEEEFTIGINPGVGVGGEDNWGVSGT